MNAANEVTIMTKRNRRPSILTALALAVMAVGGCDRGLTKVNVNPNAPETVPVTNLLLGGIRDVAATGGERGVFGQWTQLYVGENWAQHIAQPVYNDEDQYTLSGHPGIPSDLWAEMYFAIADLAAAKSSAESSGDDNIWAIAEIMTVYGFMVLTDYYDMIPYFEALDLSAEGGNAAPAYDDQADIYPDLIARLAAAAARIDPAQTLDPAKTDFSGHDPVYGGDVDRWEMFANSLRLRLAMRTGNQGAFAAAWGSTIFGSVADQADVQWTGVYPAANPVYEGIVHNGRTGDFRMSQSLIDRLAAFNDPRLPIYADPAISDGLYRGLRNGLVPGEYDAVDCDKGATETCVANDFSWIGAYFLDAMTSSPLLSYAEVLFLGAEAAELGWIGDDAETLYQEGITASMTNLGISTTDVTTYLGQAEVDYNTGTYQALDAIHVQKWIGLFMSGPEGFADLRRTGWDWTTDAGTTGIDLIPSENSQLPPGMFPARLTYPEEEELVNPMFDPSMGGPGEKSLTDPVGWAP